MLQVVWKHAQTELAARRASLYSRLNDRPDRGEVIRFMAANILRHEREIDNRRDIGQIYTFNQQPEGLVLFDPPPTTRATHESKHARCSGVIPEHWPKREFVAAKSDVAAERALASGAASPNAWSDQPDGRSGPSG